ncbi:response regulator [Nakamurella sp. YIM 132087]|uniref:Response regulator n=1 Tax=Nakamurella alba TaxID=2665158 RepID=A0A7K1FIH9_9ACTN|nr:response regulator transcription factor [Nakamurella alba]MTD13922.1 response regulator [Nakamurella alba]
MVHSRTLPGDPPVPGATAPSPPVRPTVTPAAVVRVVVVDDHRVFAELFAHALGTAGYEVCAVTFSLAEAVEQVGTHRPDVVVLDQHLPDGSGSGVVGRLRSVAPGVRVLMLTSQADPQTLMSAVGAGCDGFVTKSRGMTDVLAAVAAVARGESPIRTDLAAGAGPAAEGTDLLTPRELEVLELVCEGRANKEIAAALGLSINTVRNHVAHLLEKLGVRSKLEAVAVATAGGLVRGSRSGR